MSYGFFDNGILIITGDHHAMIPFKREEVDIFGASKAAAMIPLVISFGDKYRCVEDRAFQQVDIYNSLVGYISGMNCSSEWSGYLLGLHRIPPIYIAHKCGDNRNIISVYYNDIELRVKLDGDNTRILNPGNVNETVLNMIVNKINFERILRQDKR